MGRPDTRNKSTTFVASQLEILHINNGIVVAFLQNAPSGLTRANIYPRTLILIFPNAASQRVAYMALAYQIQ